MPQFPTISIEAQTRTSPRRFAFLVSTTDWARGISTSLGSAGYSYFFAYEALRPLLEEFGPVRLVERPESRLPFLADELRAEGFEPIHLAINPLQDIHLTPLVPTLVYPFWEFPRIPDRDFGDDTRQNWRRVLARADAVIAPCGLTAAALEAASGRSVTVVPVAIDPEKFENPDWDPNWRWEFRGRLTVWGDTRIEPIRRASTLGVVAPEGRFSSIALRLEPWIGTRRMQHLYRLKQAILPRPGESFAAKQFGLLRSAYNGHVKRWLSDDARQTITRAKRRVARILRIPERLQVDPVLPESDLSLSGLVYTTIFNVGDPRKNPGEILSAFLLAFSDRPDVTLVIKLVTNPVRERHELAHLRSLYENLGIEHRCRIVVITDYLDDHEMAGLLRATTYYVNHSFGEGACLPLMHSLAGGRPGLAPDHTAMADYVDDAVAFVTRSTPEPTHWPHDPDRRVETFRARPFWADLHRNFLQSAEVVLSDRARYDRMASAARSRMADRAGRTFVRERLASLLSGLPRFPRRLDWVG